CSRPAEAGQCAPPVDRAEGFLLSLEFRHRGGVGTLAFRLLGGDAVVDSFDESRNIHSGNAPRVRPTRGARGVWKVRGYPKWLPAPTVGTVDRLKARCYVVTRFPQCSRR